jgi:two-component system sensor kinase FixL
VLNVISNAFDAMQNPDRESCDIRIQTRRTGGEVLTSIRDKGLGISEGEIKNMFNPYFTSKLHGLGMGLSISRHIVARHNGRIWAENNVGAGATLYFTLPIDMNERRRTAKGKSSETV